MDHFKISIAPYLFEKNESPLDPYFSHFAQCYGVKKIKKSTCIIKGSRHMTMLRRLSYREEIHQETTEFVRVKKSF